MSAILLFLIEIMRTTGLVDELDTVQSETGRHQFETSDTKFNIQLSIYSFTYYEYKRLYASLYDTYKHTSKIVERGFIMDMGIEEVTQQVNGLSKDIVEYGAFAVVLAVFLLLFVITVIVILVANQKQLKKQYDNILTQNNELLGALINHTDDGKSTVPSHDYKKDIVQMYMNINFIFTNACKTTLNAVHADRVAIYVFHNGNSTPQGLPFFKMSCIGEWIIYGNSGGNKGKADMDLPLHLFSTIIDKLYREGEYYTERNDDAINLPLTDFVANSRINFLFIKGIYDTNRVLVGFTISEFSDIPDEETTNEIRISMEKLNDKVKDIIINPQVKNNLEHKDE